MRIRRARCGPRWPILGYVYRIHDADDDGADRRLRVAEDLAGAVAFVENEDSVADAGFDGGHGNEVAAAGFAGGVEAVDDEQAAILVIGVVDRRDDFAGDLGDEHICFKPPAEPGAVGRSSWLCVFYVYIVDDADDGVVDRDERFS